MTLACASGRFLVNSTDVVNTTYVVSGLSGAPKVVWFRTTGITSAADTVERGNIRGSNGMATSTSNRCCVARTHNDAQPTAVSKGGMHNDCVIATYEGTPNRNGALDVSAFASDGFTAIVDDQFPVSLEIEWFALIDSAITNATIVTVTEPASTGSQSVTSPGFQGTFAYALGSNRATVNTAGADAVSMVGAATPTDSFVALWGSDDTPSTMQTAAYVKSGEFLANFNAGISATADRATFTQFTATGFDLNWAEVSGTQYLYFVLVVKGLSGVAIDAVTTRTDGNNFATGSLGITPVGAMFISHCLPESTSDTVDNGCKQSMGWADSPSSRAVCAGEDQDNVGTSVVSRAAYSSAVYANIANGAVAALADLVSFDPDAITCVMDDTEPSAGAYVAVIAFGNSAAATALPLLLQEHGVEL